MDWDARAILMMSLMACTDKSTTDSGGDDTGGASSSFAAEEGIWTLAPASVVLDECDIGANLASNSEEIFAVEATATGVDLIFDGSDPWECTQSGNDLTCPEQISVTDWTVEGFDAVVSFSLALGGSLTSNTSMDMTLSGSYSCEGAECLPVAEAEGLTVPCTTTASSTATAG
jgi:hypothetical protein